MVFRDIITSVFHSLFVFIIRKPGVWEGGGGGGGGVIATDWKPHHWIECE